MSSKQPIAVVKDEQALQIMKALENGAIEWEVEFDASNRLVAKAYIQ
jgi:hypothetical protein